MIKMVFCVKRRSDISQQAFQDYWLEQHAPLVMSHRELLCMYKYVQSHTLSPEYGQAISTARGMQQPGFDGVAEVWWESVAALQKALESEAAQAASAELAEDEAKFIDMEASTIFFTEEHVLFGDL